MNVDYSSLQPEEIELLDTHANSASGRHRTFAFEVVSQKDTQRERGVGISEPHGSSHPETEGQERLCLDAQRRPFRRRKA
jgi:hypothetical protein